MQRGGRAVERFEPFAALLLLRLLLLLLLAVLLRLQLERSARGRTDERKDARPTFSIGSLLDQPFCPPLLTLLAKHIDELTSLRHSRRYRVVDGLKEALQRLAAEGAALDGVERSTGIALHWGIRGRAELIVAQLAEQLLGCEELRAAARREAEGARPLELRVKLERLAKL